MPDGIKLYLSVETTLGVQKDPVDISNAIEEVRLVTLIRPGLENGRLLSYSAVIEDGRHVTPMERRTITVSFRDTRSNAVSRATQQIVFEFFNIQPEL